MSLITFIGDVAAARRASLEDPILQAEAVGPAEGARRRKAPRRRKAEEGAQWQRQWQRPARATPAKPRGAEPSRPPPTPSAAAAAAQREQREECDEREAREEREELAKQGEPAQRKDLE